MRCVVVLAIWHISKGPLNPTRRPSVQKNKGACVRDCGSSTTTRTNRSAAAHSTRQKEVGESEPRCRCRAVADGAATRNGIRNGWGHLGCGNRSTQTGRPSFRFSKSEPPPSTVRARAQLRCVSPSFCPTSQGGKLSAAAAAADAAWEIPSNQLESIDQSIQSINSINQSIKRPSKQATNQWSVTTTIK